MRQYMIQYIGMVHRGSRGGSTWGMVVNGGTTHLWCKHIPQTIRSYNHKLMVIFNSKRQSTRLRNDLLFGTPNAQRMFFFPTSSGGGWNG